MRECDGICATCGEWKTSGADPDADNVFCEACENITVHGIRKAKALGIIEVK